MDAEQRQQAESLVAGAVGWGGAWTLVYAAGQAALNGTDPSSTDLAVRLTYAALDLSFALTELESVVPPEVGRAAVDLGELSRVDGQSVAAAVVDLVVAAERAVIDAAAHAGPDVTSTLLGARVSSLLSAARLKLSGGAW
ncbi:hypothetical protein [Cellulomonas fimi]|uniref:Uncharacterized protein n=1 Tax=Cellulomonas fimi TaxID=1708 RepID=A0A7Y0QIQ8_CELFI|nr:hypothetical protein [Cellulomonas fimi]NMR21149.1 hypothetical protein [Cellulomonas fimi]